MQHSKNGYKIIKFYNSFSKVIESWFQIVHKYEEKTRYDDKNGDAIYWYNERANVGAFAAALAKNNISFIEEYTCEKGKGADKFLGRADLSFFFRNKWYLVEAKIIWKSLSPKSPRLNFKMALSEACNDSYRSWQQDQGTIPLGFTFIVPYINPEYEFHLNGYLDQLFDQLQDFSDCAFWAYCAPGRLRYLQSQKYKKSYHPLVILLAGYPEKGISEQKA